MFAIADNTPCEDAALQIQMNAGLTAAASDADQALRLELDKAMWQLAQIKNTELEQLLRNAQQHLGPVS